MEHLLNILSYVFAVLLVIGLAVGRELILRRRRCPKPMTESEVLKRLNVELKRAERFKYRVALIMVEFLQHSPPGVATSLLHKVMPDEHIREEIREYDLVFCLSNLRFCVILPFQSENIIEQVVSERLRDIAQTRKWDDFRKSLAIYPDDSMESEELYRVCFNRLEKANIE